MKANLILTTGSAVLLTGLCVYINGWVATLIMLGCIAASLFFIGVLLLILVVTVSVMMEGDQER